MTTHQTQKLIEKLSTIMNDVSRGNTAQVETIFELTKEGVYPPDIVNLAESFGMMIVNIDAKQQRLEIYLDPAKDLEITRIIRTMIK